MIVFVVNTSKATQNLERPTYRYSGKHEHNDMSCFELIDYPARWTRWGSGYGYERGHDGRASHSTAGRGGGSAFACSTQTNNDDNWTVEQDGSCSVISGLTKGQVQKLICLIEAPKLGCEKILGIVARWGASYHMTGVLRKLGKVRVIHPILVNMHNGEDDIAYKSGLM